MKKIGILLIIILISLGGLYLYYREGLLPVNKNDSSTTIFVISKGKTVNDIIRDLHGRGLIRDRIAFYVLIKQLGIEGNIQAGDFRLSPSMSSPEIAQILTKGTLDALVTIVEGLRKEEVAQIISRDIGIPETEFVKQAPEGYLFPDTYLMPKDASLTAVLEIFKKNYNRKFSDELADRAKKYNLTENDVIILASLVEREARTYESRVKVASILLKRLQNDWPLDIDASVQYAIGYQTEQRTWWKRNLTKDDLKVDSPYNTYKNRGLPPGPIGNPGLTSIKAVVNADPSTPYWFYLTSKDGSTMHYSKTIEEHNSNIRKYLR